MRIDLNCDLGEEPEAGERDDRLAAVVSSLNIACGGHAGDETTMERLVRTAGALGRAVGAHPGYPDRANFGRVEMAMSPPEVEATVREQIERLARIAAANGVAVRFVKPHGALYHAAMRKRDVAEAVGRAARGVDRSLVLVGQSGAMGLEWWRGAGLVVAAEAFADRRYEPDGTLRSRTKPGALLEDPGAAAEQAVEIAMGRGVRAEDGTRIRLEADTLCVHADTPGSVAIAGAVRKALEDAGVDVGPVRHR